MKSTEQDNAENARQLADLIQIRESFDKASTPMWEIISALHWKRRGHAEELMRALDDAVVGEEPGLGEHIQNALFLAFFGAVLAVVPVGISASVFAYCAGLSNETGKWMFFAGTAFSALAFAVGALVGRRSPGRRLL